jgi:iron-sulfur cluster repair protein YtfE (RIC family)
MLRDKSLIPLSHQHQHGLALCVRIDRAQPIPPKNLALWLEEIERDFSQEFENHFSAEESVLFPAARQFPEMIPLVDELISDHAGLRECFSRMGAGTMSLEALPDFARQLSTHIRKEERQLFERLQQLLTAEQLKHLGEQLESVLEVAERACSLPSEETRLKPRSKQRS